MTQKLLKQIEWSSQTQGPGTSMGSGDGAWFPCCPVCGGIKPNTPWRGSFIPSAIGHKKNCELKKGLNNEIS